MRFTATVYIGYEVYIAASTLLQAVFAGFGREILFVF